ncbi:hypothetical protein KI387_031701, partial [Taxus chinensis]
MQRMDDRPDQFTFSSIILPTSIQALSIRWSRDRSTTGSRHVQHSSLLNAFSKHCRKQIFTAIYNGLDSRHSRLDKIFLSQEMK